MVLPKTASGRFAGMLVLLAALGLGSMRAEEVISTTKCHLRSGHQPATVEIVMTEGRFWNDDIGWCGGGEKWEGQFEIRVRSQGRLLARTSVNRLYYPQSPTESMFFWAPKFKLAMHDYNHDGLIDFNLGQYGACNWNEYRIFTIHRNGRVTELPCLEGDDSSISVSHASRRNSTNLIRVRHGRMTSTYYDNSLTPTDYITEERKWRNGKFVLVRSRSATEEEKYEPEP